MYRKLKLIIICSIVLTSFSYAQRYQIYEGGFENIKEIKSFTVAFDYENIQVHGFDSEEDFLKEKMEKRKSNPEKAAAFRRDWFSNRDQYYNPAFINYFNNYFKKGERKIVTDSPCLMKVNLTWIYPGYALEPAKLSATIEFIDTINSKKLLVIHFEKVIGMEKKTIEINEYERVIGAFEKLAKNLAIQLK
ncbi:hypothetical protein D0817_21380 [Flavobacterium cupreum]|uniref:GLPGLI family protein n=1 Tax=Flavobacterium cupreum TaxID=2133766 RepID=A0A434A261_9FLAO|nr:hypothetical protein [Flavobacterium cupreum]RUT68461.1 hypothetical protein D0817_21380 [Flavobacterium cupreum]